MSRDADKRMPEANLRADIQAREDESARLRERVAELERDLGRARRCLAAERVGREALRVRLAHEQEASDFGIGVLCRLAFPRDVAYHSGWLVPQRDPNPDRESESDPDHPDD